MQRAPLQQSKALLSPPARASRPTTKKSHADVYLPADALGRPSSLTGAKPMSQLGIHVTAAIPRAATLAGLATQSAVGWKDGIRWIMDDTPVLGTQMMRTRSYPLPGARNLRRITGARWLRWRRSGARGFRNRAPLRNLPAVDTSPVPAGNTASTLTGRLARSVHANLRARLSGQRDGDGTGDGGPIHRLDYLKDPA